MTYACVVFFFKEHILSKYGATKHAQIISSEIILGHWKGNLETLSLNSALRSTYTAHKDRILELLSGNTAKFPSKSEREISMSKFRNELQKCTRIFLPLWQNKDDAYYTNKKSTKLYFPVGIILPQVLSLLGFVW